jgi:hypothetical protein
MESENAFVQCLAKLIDNSPKKQTEIAVELGYPKPNLITMFKKGLTRVPLEKVPVFADILGVNRVFLMNLWLTTYAPEWRDTLQQVYGFMVTEAEGEWVILLRKAYDGKAVTLPTSVEDTLTALRKLAA